MDEALTHFQAAVRARPLYADAWYDMGMAQKSLGRTDEAVASWSRTLELEPRNTDALYNLAAALAEQGAAQQSGAKLAQAASTFTRLLQIRPDYPRAREDLRQVEGRLREIGSR